MLWRRKWVFYYPSKTNTFWNGDIFSNIRHAIIDNGNTSLILIYRYRYIFFISCPGYNHISFCIICRTCFKASILLLCSRFDRYRYLYVVIIFLCYIYHISCKLRLKERYYYNFDALIASYIWCRSIQSRICLQYKWNTFQISYQNWP